MSMTTDEGIAAFESLIDDNGLLPGDEGHKPAKDDTAAFEEHVEEFDENGDPIPAEPDEDEGDTDSEGLEQGEDEGTDGEGTPGDDDADKLYDVEIDGETYEVNLPELTSGYLRNEDFVKRSTELETTYSEKIAAAEAKEVQLVQELEAFAVMGLAELRQYEQINWEQLKATDPEAYSQKRIEYFDKREQVQTQITRKDQIARMSQKAADLKHQAYLEQQTALVHRLLPDFQKEGFQERLTKYATSVGFTPEEVGNIADARQLLVLEQARQFAESKVRKEEVLRKKPTADLPPVIKPGAKPPAVDRGAKRHQAAVSRLRNEGTLDAAAAAFLDFV